MNLQWIEGPYCDTLVDGDLSRGILGQVIHQKLRGLPARHIALGFRQNKAKALGICANAAAARKLVEDECASAPEPKV